MNVYVVDCEGDGLWPSKFYVLSYQKEGRDEVRSITSYDMMRKFLLQPNAIFIMHNGIRWDKPHLERVLGVTITNKVIDTLFTSWYVEPSRISHGLESYGEDFGVPKPVVDDWENLSIEDARHRCQEDVKINMRLWYKHKKYLSVLYDCNTEDDVVHLPIIDYLMFKADCAAEQERSKWKLDIDLVQNTLKSLYIVRTERSEGLGRVMPQIPKMAVREPPAKPYKKDGTLSVTGSRWQQLLREKDLPEDYKEPVQVVVGWEEPNPKSTPQVKAWLYSLGWEPRTFKYEREEDGSFRAIPQVRNKDKELCESVLELVEKEPAIELLDGLTVANHRISILEGFLEAVDDEGYVQAQMQGLTNTLRYKHRVCVNLPGVDKPYGVEIRGALIARDGYELLGSDVTSLEDMTKRHYIYPYDLKYVEEMSHPDYDPHLDLAIQAGRIKKEQAVAHVRGEEDHSRVRKPFKAVNYSSVYGVGAPKLARELGVPEHEAKAMLDVYWKRNWAVKKFAEDQVTRIVKGQRWVFNPVSKFWYSLRAEKDIFSTVNQSTGVFVFDTWLMNIRKRRKQLTAQFHDELVLEIKEGHREKAKELVVKAMEETNQQLNLNVTIKCDVKFGKNYSEIH